jgi:Carboxypeptidase regulatory-like domain
MKSSKLIVLAVLALSLLLCAHGFAQSDRGAIAGSVVDATGAVVTHAKVVATNAVTGEQRQTESSSTGSFMLPELKANPWKVTVEAKGFKTATTTEIQVAVQVTQRVNVVLEVGDVTQSVEVMGAAQSVQTESAVEQNNVSERQVRELPLSTSAEIGGRTPLSFIFLDSSVTSSDNNRGQNSTFFRANGGQALGAEILIDGANTRRAQNGSYFTEVAPGPDAYQEFTMSTSSYSAEFGNASAGVVNFTLKSGSNKLHGEVYDRFRNEALDANTWTNNDAGLKKPRDRQNDFGFNLGGPVYIPKLYDGRNKTFFFFNYNGYRFSQSENTYVSVPTLKMRAGDFSELLTDPYVLQFSGGPVQIYDPHVSPMQRLTPIPGNRLDLYQNGAALDNAGMALINAFPTPTREGVFHNYAASSSAPINMDSEVVKLDHVINDRQKVSGSYTYRNQPSIKGGFPRLPYPAIATGVWNQEFKSHFARVQHDYAISNTLLNHFNIGWNRVWVANANSTLGFDPVTLGIPADATARLTFPMIEFPGYGSSTGTDPRSYQGIGSTWWNDHMGDNQVEMSDSLSWAKGKHMFKFGVDFRIQQLNMMQNFDNGGHFNFRSDQTAGIVPVYAADGTTITGYNNVGGWPTASLATGATEWSWTTVTDAQPAWRYFNQAYFINDDVKVNSKLTVNLGFRYEYQRPRTEAHNWYRAFDLTAMNPVVNRVGAIAGAGGQGNVASKYPGLFAPDRTDASPRLGFAYALNSKTVIRGGIGLYYAPFLYDASSGFIGYRAARTITPPYSPNHGEIATSAYLSSYPAHVPTDPGGQFIGSDVDYYNVNAKAGRTEQWNLDIQRELPSNMVFSIGYVGNKGTRLRSGFNRINALPLDDLKLGYPLLTKGINDVTAADRTYAQSVGVTLPASGDAVYAGFSGSVAQALKPFPQYNRINTVLDDRGQSWYHALNLKLNKHFSHGLQFGAAYTWSKLITTAGDDLWGNTPLNGALQNPFDPLALRSVSPSNPASVVVFSYIYELPFGKGQPLLNNNSVLDKIVGGWQFNGIHRYQSGLPLAVSLNDAEQRAFLDTVGYWGNIRPNLTGKPVLTGESLSGATVMQINPAAFSAPQRYDTPPTDAMGNALPVSDPAYGAYYANPLAFFGTAPATLANARVKPYFSENLSLLKNIPLKESLRMEFGAEFFNPFNRHAYWMPDTNLAHWDGTSFTNQNFGKANVVDDSNVYSPRIIQLRLRVLF